MKDAYQLNLLSIALVIRRNLILPTTPTSLCSILLLFFRDPEEIKEASPAEYVICLNMYSPDQLILIEHNFVFYFYEVWQKYIPTLNTAILLFLLKHAATVQF